MDSNGRYTVTDVRLTQTPQLSAAGTMTQATVLTFVIGGDNKYTLTFPTQPPAPADVLAAITAQVDYLRAVDAGVAQLNMRA
jgi:hypothetical protein